MVGNGVEVLGKGVDGQHQRRKGTSWQELMKEKKGTTCHEMGHWRYSFNPQMDMKTEHSREIKGDNDDDDAFYAELRRQILILTSEDDDDADLPRSKHSNLTRGAREGSSPRFSASLIPGSYFSWLEKENTNTNACAVPVWLVNLWRSGNGTGVFIPHIVKSRRRRKKSGKRYNKQASGIQE
ncbi:hypothetical protein TEA_012508 [Camellia sinensis var. sinensis]|uniref:Uncharacterized protein n=2 Tax=Camellia sinensis TaxID=4442 RepID=A0A4S4E3J1_CAMSN|nr:hypothetical protein TEA_012508 [Camellia sinensis var. sinensis]